MPLTVLLATIVQRTSWPQHSLFKNWLTFHVITFRIQYCIMYQVPEVVDHELMLT